MLFGAHFTPAAAPCNKTVSMVLAHILHSRVVCINAVLQVSSIHISIYTTCIIQRVLRPRELWLVRSG